MTFGAEIAMAWPNDFRPLELAQRMVRAQRVIFIGNGGSAAIASHMANDFSKNGDLVTLAFNDPASLTCLANDLGYDAVFAHPLEKHVTLEDLLIAISSSGRSENILRAVQVASQHDAEVVTLTGFDDTNPLRQMGDKNYHVASHDYGIVETVHLGMLHAALRELPNVER